LISTAWPLGGVIAAVAKKPGSSNSALVAGADMVAPVTLSRVAPTVIQ
jgi:hypothetical protein